MKKSQMMGMPSVTPHSGPTSILKHNATRTSKASPMVASVIPHSGSKPGMPSMSNDNIGQPYAVASDRTEQMTPMNHFQPIPHSETGVPRAPKKWNKRKMSAGVQTS